MGSIWLNWALFLVSNALLGSSVMMMVKGTMPPPFASRKASPVFATGIFVVGLTMMLVYGEPDLLQVTIEALTKG